MRRIFIILAIVLMPYFCVFCQNTIDNDYGNYLLSQSDKLITLDLEGATLVDVLKLLSQQSNINFILDQSVVPRNLTLYLTKTPLSEAMDIIFRTNNLTYNYYSQSNVFVVRDAGPAASALVTKTYYLKYARIGRSSMSAERNSTLGTTGLSSIQDSLRTVLSPQGTIVEDVVSNSVIITDYARQFVLIEQLLKSIDISMPQIMIEVEMLDVSKRLVDSIGVNWPESMASLDISGQRGTRFPFGRRAYDAEATTWSELITPGGVEMESVPVDKFSPSVLTVIGAELVLNMMRSDSSTKSLARPKILTMSNEPAEVNLTVDEVIGVERTTSDTGGGSSTTYAAERAQTGTHLRVTPQINPENDEITLVLNIFNRESKNSGLTIEGSALKNVEERSTKSLVRLKNGETLLIGGLLKKNSDETVTKVPFLGDIPWVGKMFRYNSKDSSERELLVFLTPRIIRDSEVSLLDNFSLEREQWGGSKLSLMRSALDRAEKRVN